MENLIEEILMQKEIEQLPRDFDMPTKDDVIGDEDDEGEQRYGCWDYLYRSDKL